MHGEATEKDGKLHIALLDKDMKPVQVDAHALTATACTREKPMKLEVTKGESGFTVSAPKAGEWMILQYKERDVGKNHHRTGIGRRATNCLIWQFGECLPV